ncbi:unnamed protein product [Rhizophagus irregularis]|uniref:Uncharacterized protein n=1 Tax=Rhizophagus irregularis TaxID=588596 RepID=A0A916E9Z7_9GLOM|nr:unnamed protein product [Rhizophagus irregularis]CAB5201602.1 unnamed protein product [Rhizophagus irregularis]CAB5371543.1 unnamed protein product [Rhizophagus irregularis]
MIVSEHDCTVLDDASETIAEIASKVSFRGAIYRFFCPRFVCSGVQVQNRHQHKSLVLCCVEEFDGFSLGGLFIYSVHLAGSLIIKLFIIVAETFADIIRLEKPHCAKIPKFSWLVSALCTILTSVEALDLMVLESFALGVQVFRVLRIEKGLGL